MKTTSLLIVFASLVLASCASEPSCEGPQSRNLSAAVDQAKGSLANGWIGSAAESP